MDLISGKQSFSIEVEQEQARFPSFLTDPYFVAIPIRKQEWWEKFDPDQRLIKGEVYFALKRIMDLTLAIILMPFLLPIMVVCAALIKLESPGGPVLFRQERTGKGGRRFPMYKFRTMVPNAEELKQELAHLNVLRWPDFKIPDDPRITRMGKFLRKTSLDEVPQIFNIIKGEMSFVGPRPTSFHPNTYDLWHTERLDVTPGLTGLWQVYGRASMEFDERVRLDVAYIERRGLLLDLLIIIQTVLAVIQRRGAV